MKWYYSVGAERKGPVEEAELLRLLETAQISGSTLVWKAGLTGWVPLAETSLQTTPGQATARLVCIITGRAFAESEMIKTAHGWVSAEGKNTYYQALREGLSPMLAGTGATAWRDGKRVVVPIEGARMPARCVKTNGPVTPDQFKTKKLYWAHPAIYFALLLNVLILFILYLILRKKATVAIPLSPQGRARLRTNMAIATAGGLAGIGLIIWPFAAFNGDRMLWLLPLGFVVVIAALIFGNLKATIMRVTRIRDGKAWLAGASPEYLDSLPPING